MIKTCNYTTETNLWLLYNFSVHVDINFFEEKRIETVEILKNSFHGLLRGNHFTISCVIAGNIGVQSALSIYLKQGCHTKINPSQEGP